MAESARIVVSRKATHAEWQALQCADEHATFFHGPAWAAAWQAATHGALQPDPTLVQFADGRRAILVLSWRRKLGGLLATAVSSPGETYGGWVADGPLDAGHARALAERFQELASNLRWKLNPFAPETATLAALGGAPDSTLVLDLAPGFETLRRNWTRGHRSGANKAALAGVSVRLADHARDWEAYGDVVAETHRRWGQGAEVITYPPTLLQALARHGGADARLWLAERRGELLAGALLLHARRHVAYWHGAARTASLPLRPVNLLLQEALRAACATPGLRWFDFGSSGPLAGVAAFKRSFGARPMLCPTLRTETELRRWLRRSSVAGQRLLLGRRTPSERLAGR